MRALLNCLTTVVSLCCVDDDDCDFTNDNITVGKWVISDDLEFDINVDVVATAAAAGDLWPHQVMSWEYYTGNELSPGFWLPDPQLTVIGNIDKVDLDDSKKDLKRRESNGD